MQGFIVFKWWVTCKVSLNMFTRWGFVEFEGCPLDKVALICNALWCANFSWIWMFVAVQGFIEFARCDARSSWSWMLEVLLICALLSCSMRGKVSLNLNALHTPGFLSISMLEGVLLKWECWLRYKVSLLDMKTERYERLCSFAMQHARRGAKFYLLILW